MTPTAIRAVCDLPHLTAAFGFTLALMLPLGAVAQGVSRSPASTPHAAVPSPASPKAPTEQGVRWRDLKAAQQTSLKPLERDWAGIDSTRKQKWLQLAARFPKMSAAEQARVQARMTDWARLTPLERGQTRLNFQEAVQLPVQDRQARWDAYQALPPEQKRQLAARATPGAPASGVDVSHRATAAETRPDRATGREPAQVKSNIVPNPALANRPKAVSPTVVRASPGATTTMISKRPMPPSHQQAGLPKIAATPEFVDKATLLPQRGPQGAAAHPATVPGPERTQRQ
jgi:hypothetical protein